MYLHTHTVSAFSRLSLFAFLMLISMTMFGQNLSISSLDYQLYVEKGIRTEKVKVDAKGNWPDFVFEDNYTLPSLMEVEQFITTNKHLPNVPSAAEVEIEGVDLGEMDKILLQKIEELTLYMIEQQKQIELLKKELEKSKK